MKNITKVKGLGGTTLFALGLICYAREAKRSAQLNDATGNVLTDAEDICRRNPNLLEETLRALYSEGGWIQ